MGCGLGFFLEEARDAGWDAHGSEFETRAVEINRSKGFNCLEAPIGVHTFDRGYFDVVTAFEVVEHLRDPSAEAAVIAHALRPGGLFYCTTPNFASLSRRVLGSNWAVVSYPEHLLYFTPSSLCRWLTRVGFVPLKVRTTGVSLAILQKRFNLTPSTDPALDEEQLRVDIEKSPVLQTAKMAVNAALAVTRSGDTIKGHFELQDSVLRSP
jgi:SAM-dependent methyltransferase